MCLRPGISVIYVGVRSDMSIVGLRYVSNNNNTIVNSCNPKKKILNFLTRGFSLHLASFLICPPYYTFILISFSFSFLGKDLL